MLILTLILLYRQLPPIAANMPVWLPEVGVLVESEHTMVSDGTQLINVQILYENPCATIQNIQCYNNPSTYLARRQSQYVVTEGRHCAREYAKQFTAKRPGDLLALLRLPRDTDVADTIINGITSLTASLIPYVGSVLAPIVNRSLTDLKLRYDRHGSAFAADEEVFIKNSVPLATCTELTSGGNDSGRKLPTGLGLRTARTALRNLDATVYAIQNHRADNKVLEDALLTTCRMGTAMSKEECINVIMYDAFTIQNTKINFALSLDLTIDVVIELPVTLYKANRLTLINVGTISNTNGNINKLILPTQAIQVNKIALEIQQSESIGRTKKVIRLNLTKNNACLSGLIIDNDASKCTISPSQNANFPVIAPGKHLSPIILGNDCELCADSRTGDTICTRTGKLLSGSGAIRCTNQELFFDHTGRYDSGAIPTRQLTALPQELITSSTIESDNNFRLTVLNMILLLILIIALLALYLCKSYLNQPSQSPLTYKKGSSISLVELESN